MFSNPPHPTLSDVYIHCLVFRQFILLLTLLKHGRIFDQAFNMIKHANNYDQKDDGEERKRKTMDVTDEPRMFIAKKHNF